MPSVTEFTATDADWLRRQKPSLTATTSADFASAPAQLIRYFQHYQFDAVLGEKAQCTYAFGFSDWSGFSVAHHAWTLPGAAATVVIVHGLFDHTGLYLRLVDRLLSEGFNVLSLDLPGHGLSEGEPASIKSFRQYSGVLAACVGSCDSELPIYVVAQSTGCCALLDIFLRDGESDVHSGIVGAVLLAPLLRAYAWNGIKALHWLLSRLIKKLPRHFGPNSHDKDFLHFLNHEDPLQPRQICTDWVSAMRLWERRFRKAGSLPLEGLVIQGTRDKTVDWRWNVPHIQEKFPRLLVHYVPGAMHHLVGEGGAWRRDVYDSLCRYLRGTRDAEAFNQRPDQ